MSGADPATVPIEVARIAKNSRETLIFSLTEFKGHRLVSARAWAKKEDGSEIPTKNGLSLRIELLDDVCKALALVEQAARDAGWIGAGNAAERVAAE